MATFTDDFQRANGSLGGNWVNGTGTATITGYYAGGSGGSATAYNTTVSDGTRLKVSSNVAVSSNANVYVGPAVKCGALGADCYFACVVLIAGVHYFRIYRQTTSAVQLATATLSEPVPSYGKITIEWNQGALTATWRDTTTITANDSDLASQAYGGFRASGAVQLLDDIQIVGGSDPSLSVSPSPIGNYGSPLTVTFTGSNVSWTPGTPGSPTFTVDHGTLSDQVVDTSSTAHATYNPGNFLGVAVFTDPSTGAVALVTVTSNPATVPPSGGDTWSPYKTLVDATGQNGDPTTLFTDQTPFITANLEYPTVNVPLLTGLQEIYAATVLQQVVKPGTLQDLYLLWQLINGANPYVAGTDLSAVLGLTKSAVDELVTRTDLGKTGGSYNVGSLLREIAGFPGGSIQDVLTAIASLPAPDVDLSPVLDELDAIRGDTTTSLYTLLSSLAGIRTTNALSLQDVIDAVGSPTVDLSAITNKLSLIQPSTAYSLTTLASQSSGLITSVGDLSDVLTFITSDGEISLATLKLILDAIQELLEALKVQVPPVWIGGDGETLGTPVSLVDQLVVDGPMDGVLIDVTTPPQRLGRYVVGGETLDYGVGRVTFAQEDGYCEMWQYLSFRKAIYVPKAMTVATSANFQVVGGAEGTVTPFIRS